MNSREVFIDQKKVEIDRLKISLKEKETEQKMQKLTDQLNKSEENPRMNTEMNKIR